MFKKLLNWLSGKSEEAAVSPSGGMHDIESFVDYVARSLVDSPEAVKVRSTEEADVFGIQIICKIGSSQRVFKFFYCYFLFLPPQIIVCGISGNNYEPGFNILNVLFM